MSPPMCSIVLYLVCAGMMMTVWCAEPDADKREIGQYEAMFKQFRDKKSETDHYNVVYSALLVFRQCNVVYQAGESEAKFRSLSFVDQIDLVIKALVKIQLVPDGLVNPVKQNTMTEGDFHFNYNAMPGGFLKDDHFDPKNLNCRMILHYFLVNLFSSNYSESDATRSSTLGVFFSGFYKEFMDKVYNSKPEVVYGRVPPKPKPPTWKVPRWQTVATYFGGAAVLGGLIAAGMHFWRTEPYTQMMANMSNSTQATIHSGIRSTGGIALAASSPWTIVTMAMVMISVVAIVAAFVVYRLMSSTASSVGARPSSNSQSKATTRRSSTGSTRATTPVSH